VRKVKLNVAYESKSGAQRSASAKTEFDATGFGGQCKGMRTAAESEAPRLEEEGELPVGSPEGDEKPTQPAPTNSTPTTQAEEDAEIVAPPPSGKYE
jgi:hypothetical protein